MILFSDWYVVITKLLEYLLNNYLVNFNLDYK